MKLKSLITTSVLALASGALLGTSAHAANLAYTPGDLFLSFRADGVSQDYIVDIGAASLYRDATVGSSFTVSGLGNIGTDLTTLFGANWHNRSDLYWSVIGTPGTTSAVNGDAIKTLYASREESVFGEQSDPWMGGSTFGQGTPSNKITAMGLAYGSTAGVANLSSENSSVAYIQNTSDANSYAFFTASGASFSYFNPTIEGTFTNGAASSALDLYRIPVGSGVPGHFEGSFQIDNRANVKFNSEIAAVPEPSTYCMTFLGAGLLAFMNRRRQQATVAA